MPSKASGSSFSVDQLGKTDALSSNCEEPHTSAKPEASIPKSSFAGQVFWEILEDIQ